MVAMLGGLVLGEYKWSNKGGAGNGHFQITKTRALKLECSTFGAFSRDAELRQTQDAGGQQQQQHVWHSHTHTSTSSHLALHPASHPSHGTRQGAVPATLRPQRMPLALPRSRRRPPPR